MLLLRTSLASMIQTHYMLLCKKVLLMHHELYVGQVGFWNDQPAFSKILHTVNKVRDRLKIGLNYVMTG